MSIVQDSYKILQDLNKISTWEDNTSYFAPFFRILGFWTTTK